MSKGGRPKKVATPQDGKIHRVPLFGKWVVHSDRELESLRTMAGGEHRGYVEQYLGREAAMGTNGLAFFLGHGLPWSKMPRRYADGQIVIAASEYAEEYRNDGIAFVNDYVSDYLFLLSPRKLGKSYAGAAAIGTRLCRCDPRWPCFTENGLVYREFEGPKIAVVASFSWPNVGELWKVYQEVLPEDELGPYAKHGKKALTFGDGRPKSITLKKSGSQLIFLCYTQLQHVWENFKSHYLHADEQIPLAKLGGWEDGTRTMGRTQALFTLSGFALPDRPDTGEAGELKRGIYDGTRTRGKTVGRYHMDIQHTPDAIISKEKKVEIYDQYVNPNIERSKKEARRAMAVYYPGWEPRGGMVFEADVWDRAIHIVNPMWGDDETPKDLTKWRVVDYGSEKGINVCSWWATGPLRVLLSAKPKALEGIDPKRRGEVYSVCYRLLYETGMEIADLVPEIIRMSGNTRERIEDQYDSTTGNTYQTWREKVGRESYWGGTLLDPRSSAQSQQGQTLADIFSRYGIESVTPACGQRDDIQIPRLKDKLRIDWKRRHPFRVDSAGEATLGVPELFFFDGKVGAGVREIEGLRKPDDGMKGFINSKDPSHFVDTAKWWASDNPRYMGDDWAGDAKRYEREIATPAGNPYTGY